jgi:hypothetical protein
MLTTARWNLVAVGEQQLAERPPRRFPATRPLQPRDDALLAFEVQAVEALDDRRRGPITERALQHVDGARAPARSSIAEGVGLLRPADDLVEAIAPVAHIGRHRAERRQRQRHLLGAARGGEEQPHEPARRAGRSSAARLPGMRGGALHSSAGILRTATSASRKRVERSCRRRRSFSEIRGPRAAAVVGFRASTGFEQVLQAASRAATTPLGGGRGQRLEDESELP